MLFRTFVALLAAAVLSVLSACSNDKAPGAGPDANGAPQTSKPAKDPVLVRVRPVAVGPIELRLEATANVESLNVVAVSSERAEPVLEIFVEEGDAVVAGQELARLRSDQVALAVRDAEVRVKQCASLMVQTERDYLRNQRLWDEGGTGGRLVAEQALENSLQLWDAAKTAHDSALVALDRAKWDERRCVLRAPIDGTVTARDISVGDMATAVNQQSIRRAFEITDLSQPKVVFYRPQRELSLLRVGQELTATSEALPGAEIIGRIERVSPVVDAATGTVKVVAALDPAGRVIPVGVLMRLVLVLERHESALLVPREALLYEGEGMAVFVIREGVARRVVLQPGFEDAQNLEVLPDSGLTAGELLVVVGADRLAEGDQVEIAGE
jgi:membrane fusion protein (multidrug efflux system)